MRPTLLWLHANGCNIVALHFASHRTIEMLGLVAPKFDWFQTICNKCQQNANIVVVPRKRTQHVGMLHVVGNNVASACMGL